MFLNPAANLTPTPSYVTGQTLYIVCNGKIETYEFIGNDGQRDILKENATGDCFPIEGNQVFYNTPEAAWSAYGVGIKQTIERMRHEEQALETGINHMTNYLEMLDMTHHFAAA